MDGKLLSVPVVLLALNQLSGINIVLSYSKQLFMKVFFYNEERTDFWLLILAAVQILATFIGGWLTHKFGRKFMLIAGGYVATAALFSIFIVYSFSAKSVMWLIGLIVVFIIAYASTVGVVPVLYLGELFPNLAGINVIYWAFSLVGMTSSELMLTNLGVGKSFFVYGAVSFLCIFILDSEMVESHDKTSKELRNEYIYQNKDEGTVLQYQSMKTADPNVDENNSLIEMEQ